MDQNKINQIFEEMLEESARACKATMTEEDEEIEEVTEEQKCKGSS